MNNNEELRSLTWKYFWKRKREEVLYFVKELLFTILIIIWIFSGVFWAAALISVSSGGEVPVTFIKYCKLFFKIGFLLLSIYKITSWLRQNWKLATKDAKKELRTKSKENKR